MHDAAVAIAVGDEDFAIGENRHVGGSIEVGFVLAGNADGPDGLQQFPFRRVFLDNVLIEIRDPNGSVRSDA